MKNILTAILILASASVFGQGFSVSSTVTGQGGNVWCWGGGTAAGTEGCTNMCFAAVVPGSGQTPVIDRLYGASELSWDKRTNGWGTVALFVPNNAPLILGADIDTGRTNYVITGRTPYTNSVYKNTMASNTVLLTYNATNSAVAYAEPYQIWATGAADPFTNIHLRHIVPLGVGSKVWTMRKLVEFPCVHQATNTTHGSAAWTATANGEITGPIRGVPGVPLMITVKGSGPTTNFVWAVGHYE